MIASARIEPGFPAQQRFTGVSAYDPGDVSVKTHAGEKRSTRREEVSVGPYCRSARRRAHRRQDRRPSLLPYTAQTPNSKHLHQNCRRRWTGGSDERFGHMWASPSRQPPAGDPAQKLTQNIRARHLNSPRCRLHCSDWEPKCQRTRRRDYISSARESAHIRWHPLQACRASGDALFLLDMNTDRWVTVDSRCGGRLKCCVTRASRTHTHTPATPLLEHPQTQ
jgi:hypothetical protein